MRDLAAALAVSHHIPNLSDDERRVRRAYARRERRRALRARRAALARFTHVAVPAPRRAPQN